MRPRHVALPLALSVLLVGAPAGTTSYAAGSTCLGRAATIVGEPGTSLIGTNGRDVIVTNGSTSFDAGGGDDVVCLGQQEITGNTGVGRDRVVVDAGDAPVRYTLRLGRGDDTVIELSPHAGEGSRYAGGWGQDTLKTRRWSLSEGWLFEPVWLDLSRHRVDYDQPVDSPDVHFTGFENAGLAGEWVSAKGDGRDNTFVTYACRSGIHGGAGNDDLRGHGAPLACSHVKVGIRAGAGDDRLVGGPGRDWLSGQSGHDTALGRGGEDTCFAEVTRRCEVS